MNFFFDSFNKIFLDDRYFGYFELIFKVGNNIWAYLDGPAFLVPNLLQLGSLDFEQYITP